MKKILIVLFVTAICFSLTGCKEKENEISTEEIQLVGGWEETEGDLTEEDKELFNKAMETLGETDMKFTPIKLLETQVVAGVNYKFLVRANNKEANLLERKVIVIYQDLNQNLTITSIEDYSE